jgi:hypothetical protein
MWLMAILSALALLICSLPGTLSGMLTTLTDTNFIKSMTEAYGADVVSMFDGLTAFLKANESLITDMSVPMYLVNLAFRLFLCLFGNNLYYRFVLKHVSKIRQNAPTDHIRKALLDSEGGTSIWNILGCCGIYYGAVFGLYMVLMLMFI